MQRLAVTSIALLASFGSASAQGMLERIDSAAMAAMACAGAGVVYNDGPTKTLFDFAPNNSLGREVLLARDCAESLLQLPAPMIYQFARGCGLGVQSFESNGSLMIVFGGLADLDDSGKGVPRLTPTENYGQDYPSYVGCLTRKY